MVTSLFQRVGSAALSTARQLAADQAGQPFASIADRYELNTRYYWNEQYQVVDGVVQLLKSQAGLYRNTRAVRNPIARAVNRYPGMIYPGKMTPDGLPLPDGTPSCIPFAADTEEELRLAMTQALLWANWGSERAPFCRNLAILGDAFGEIEVDYERGVVYPKFHHPGRVKDIEWNGSGDVVLYRLEIPQYDPVSKQSYRWGKKVTRESITTYYNDQPKGYDGQEAEIENEWGFVPAAWCQFVNAGGQHGASIVDFSRAKIDELNSSLSAIHDYIQKFVNQGVIISAPGGRKAFEESNASKASGGSTADRVNPQGGRQELPYVFAPPGTEFFKPLDNLGLEESVEHIHDLIEEIEADLPEATLDSKIQQFTQPPSGKALSMMFGGVESRVDEASNNADHMLIKLMQMSVSIGGHLVNSGSFGARRMLTDHQQRFLPFDLESFKAGELSVTLLPRPLFPETAMERTQTAIARESIQTIQGMIEAGYSLDDIYGEGAAPDRLPGLLEQRQGAAASVSDMLGRALNGGQA